jgi:hypothetical protein
MPYSEVCKMPYDELVGWFAYFKARPPEWRADNRAYVVAVSASQGGLKKKPEELFDSIKGLKAYQERLRNELTQGQQQAQSIQRSGFLGFLMKSAKHNNIDWGVRTSGEVVQDAEELAEPPSGDDQLPVSEILAGTPGD